MHRIACNKAAFTLIAKNPILGIGTGNFTVASRATSNPALFFGDPNNLLTHVHNDFLEIWVEQGVLAFVSFLSVIIVMFVSCIGIARKRREKNRYICAAIAFSVLGFSIYIMDTIAVGNMASVFYFWVIMGLGYLAIEETQGTDKPPIIIKLPAHKKYAPFIFFVCLSVGILASYIATRKYLADIAVKHAYDFANDGRNDAALKVLNQAITFDSKSVDAIYQRGFILFSQGQYEAAIDEFLHVNHLAPGYLNSYFNLASCYYRQRDFVNAIRYAEFSYTSFPSYEPSAVLLSYLYYYSGYLDKAKHVVSSALNDFPDNPKLISLISKIETASLSKKE